MKSCETILKTNTHVSKTKKRKLSKKISAGRNKYFNIVRHLPHYFAQEATDSKLQEKNICIRNYEFLKKIQDILKQYAIRSISNEILRTKNTPHLLKLRLAPRIFSTKTIRNHKTKENFKKICKRKNFLFLFYQKVLRVKLLTIFMIYIYLLDNITQKI